MRIIYSIFIIMVLSGVVVPNIYSKDASRKEVSKDALRKKMRSKYLRSIDKAGLMQRRVLDYNESKYGVNSVETLRSLEALAWMNMEKQNFQAAEEYYWRIIKIRKELLPQSDGNIKELATVYFMLGDTYLYRSYYTKAIGSYDLSLSLAVDHGHRGDTLSREGIAGEGLEDYERALGFYLEALKEYDAAKTLNPQNAKLINKRVLIVYKRLPELYHKLGENKKVKEYQNLIKDMKAQREKERKAEEDGI